MDTAIARPELLLVADAVAREKTSTARKCWRRWNRPSRRPAAPNTGTRRTSARPSTARPATCGCRAGPRSSRRSRTRKRRSPLHIAKQFEPEKNVGEFIVDPLPPIDFGRIAAQTAKQVIVQRVREYERKRQYDEFKDRVGEIINGVVKRTEYGNLMVELGRAEALLRRDELIPRESFRNGDRVRAYIYDVREEPRGPQIFLSPHASRLPGQAVRAGSAGDL